MRPGERGSGSRPWREGAEGPEFALASRAEAARGGRAEGGGGPWPRGGRALPGHARRGSLRASGSAVAAVAWLSAAEGSTPALGFPAGRGTSGLGDGRGEAGCSGGLARPLRHPQPLLFRTGASPAAAGAELRSTSPWVRSWVYRKAAPARAVFAAPGAAGCPSRATARPVRLDPWAAGSEAGAVLLS